jgi:outer membrane protein OmpA-like peptidoglycan-associated protein
MGLKRGPKFLGIGLLAAGAVFGANHYLKNHGEVAQKSTTVKVQGDLQGFEDSAPTTPAAAGSFVAPSTKVASIAGPRIKMQVIPWNALAGLNLANGGVATTEGSLMAAQKINLTLERQDDYGKMKEGLTACANEVKQGARVCTTGVQFAVIMGDAGASFITGLNRELVKIAPEVQAEIIPGFGRSLGEDKFMVPSEVGQDPKKMAGLLVAGVLMDGDWNIALYAARQNGVCNNPDVKTYNPDCLNWVGTSSFGEADQLYIAGHCEDRPVVRNDDKGVTKRTGETQKVCVNSVVTWFPGDKEVFDNKGGLVSGWSTRENSSQMAAVLVGIRKWDLANRQIVEGITDAALKGGEQIRQYKGAALVRAGQASAAIFKEGTAQYWAKYYNGVQETDAQGNQVTLGGSQAFDLPTAARYFGLVDGASDSYADAYTLFGKIMQEQYPQELPEFLPASEVVNTSYLKAVLLRGGANVMAQAATPQYQESAGPGRTLAARNWAVNFASGKDVLLADGIKTLAQLRQELNMSEGTIIEVHGHTDNTGNQAGNDALSLARAKAVQQYLNTQSPVDFPLNRVKTVAHGQSMPLASNATAEGRAKNRRVEIVIKVANQ